jgi:Streptomycin adenylyltransferase
METQDIAAYDIPFISEGKTKKIQAVLTLLSEQDMVSAIMLGGSLSYQPDPVKADADLFCLIGNVKDFEQHLLLICPLLPAFDVLIYQGHFPWTQQLYTLYFDDDDDFSIDICLVGREGAADFFWEPDGHMLFDKSGELAAIRARQKENSRFSDHPFNKSNPFCLCIVTLKKIEKNLRRGHLWNAIELLNVMRRYVMQIIRVEIDESRPYLGRPDRDIEEVISDRLNERLAGTAAAYDRNDIAACAINLCDIFLEYHLDLLQTNEAPYYDWVMWQLRHEKENLLTLLKNA